MEIKKTNKVLCIQKCPGYQYLTIHTDTKFDEIFPKLFVPIYVQNGDHKALNEKVFRVNINSLTIDNKQLNINHLDRNDIFFNRKDAVKNLENYKKNLEYKFKKDEIYSFLEDCSLFLDESVSAAKLVKKVQHFRKRAKELKKLWLKQKEMT